MVPKQMKTLGNLLHAHARGLDLLFFEHWNPKLETNVSGKFRYHWSASERENTALGEEVKLADFPVWKNVSRKKHISQAILTKEMPHLHLPDSRSSIIASVDYEDDRYGLLFVLGKVDSEWTQNDIELVDSFRQLMGENIHENKEFIKEMFDLEVKLRRKERAENYALPAEDKAKIILSNLVEEDGPNEMQGGHINWDSEADVDEVVLSIQAYSKDRIDPVRTAWFKLSDHSIVKELQHKKLKSLRMVHAS